MTTIRERVAEYPVAQGITRADVMAASDRRALLAAGDALADECEDARQWLASRAAAPEVQDRIEAALARWLDVAGER